MQGYYLNQGNCVQVEKIEHCKKYDSVLDFTKCIECEPNYNVEENLNECVY